MIKHIVMWKLKEEAEGESRDRNAEKIKKILEDLPKEIPEIKLLEVGFNYSDSLAAFDLALVTEFTSKENLQTYLDHPEHRKAAAFIGSVVSDRVVVDYEL